MKNGFLPVAFDRDGLAPSQMKILMEALDRKMKIGCPLCGNCSCGIIAQKYYYPYDSHGTRPFIIRICDNCGFMMHIDLTLLGVDQLLRGDVNAMEEIKC